MSTQAASVGHLVVVEDFGLATDLNRLFDEPVVIEPGTTPFEQVTGATNQARTVWRAFGGMSVVTATLPDDDLGQWLWTHDGLVWIAVGSLVMEGLVSGLIGQQQAAARPTRTTTGWSLGGCSATGCERSRDICSSTFPWLPRWSSSRTRSPVTAPNTSTSAMPCRSTTQTHWSRPPMTWPWSRRPSAVSAPSVGSSTSWSPRRAMGLRDDVVDGVPVRRDDTNIVVVDGDDVIGLSSSDPATLVEMEPFIVQLVTRQREPEVSTSTRSRSVPVCSAANNAPTTRRTARYTSPTAPRHTRAKSSMSSTSAHPWTPSIRATSRFRRSPMRLCIDAFADYVGIDFNSSRAELPVPPTQRRVLGDRRPQGDLHPLRQPTRGTDAWIGGAHRGVTPRNRPDRRRDSAEFVVVRAV